MHNQYLLLGEGILLCTRSGPHSWATGPKHTPLLARHPYWYMGTPFVGLASSPAYGGSPSPRDQARSTMPGMVPIRGMHILNHAHYSRDRCPCLHMKGSPVEGRVPSTPKKGSPHLGPIHSAGNGGVPTHGPCALNRERRGPNSWRAPSSAHRGVLTRGACPEKCPEGSLLQGQASSTALSSDPHHWAVRP